MKKTIALLLALLLSLALVACDELPLALTGEDETPPATPAQSHTPAEDTAEPANEAANEPAQSPSQNSDPDKDYYLGDTIETVFFSYTVVDAMATSTYGDYTAAAGNLLVVVKMFIENKETYSMPMGQYDFQIQWGEGDEDFDYPMGKYSPEQLEDEYEIPIAGTAEGVLVFEVPGDCKDFNISYMEYFEDDSEGNAFFTYFTVKPTQTAA